MTTLEIEKFSLVLSKNFPMSTESDGELAWESCRSFSLKVTTAAVEAHRLELGSRVFRPDPGRLAAICRAATATTIDSPLCQRTRSYLDLEKRHCETVQAEWKQIETFLAGISDETLADAKRQVLEDQPEMERFWAKRDPRGWRPLMGAIARSLQKGVGVHA